MKKTPKICFSCKEDILLSRVAQSRTTVEPFSPRMECAVQNLCLKALHSPDASKDVDDSYKRQSGHAEHVYIHVYREDHERAGLLEKTSVKLSRGVAT